MKLKAIDHFVITTTDLQKCLDFYVGLLGMEHHDTNGHHTKYPPQRLKIIPKQQKADSQDNDQINIEFKPMVAIVSYQFMHARTNIIVLLQK